MDTSNKQVQGFFNTYVSILLIGGTLATLECPDVTILKGSTNAIACSSDRNFTDFYWYRGSNSISNPILRMEGRKKGGTEYGSKNFDIASNGSMIIIDANTEHESFYTFIGYYDVMNFEKASFLVNVTYTPQIQCPHINGCERCDECLLEAKTRGKLTCAVTTTPPIPLEWIVISHSGIFFTKLQQVQTYNENNHRWETNITVDYTITDQCKGNALLSCLSGDESGVFIKNASLIEITTTGTCTSSTFAPASNDEDLSLIMTIVFVMCVLFVGFLAFAMLSLWFGFRRQARIRRNGDSGEPRETTKPVNTTDDFNKIEQLPQNGDSGEPRETTKLLNITDDSNKIKQLQQNADSGEPGEAIKPVNTTDDSNKTEQLQQNGLLADFAVNCIRNVLKEAYLKCCYLRPLPWGEDIPIASLYTQTNLAVTENDGSTSLLTSDDLLGIENMQKWNRLVIVGNFGFGKTTLTKHLVQHWIKNDSTDYLMIYIHLKDVRKDSCLSEIVEALCPNDISIDNIEDVLRASPCLILLDGLDELAMSSGEEKTGEKAITDKVTIEDLLTVNGKLSSFSNINLWVTTREMDYVQSPISLPYTKAQMIGFNKKQISQYVERTCQYYLALDVHNMETDEQIDSTSTSIDYEIQNCQSSDKNAKNLPSCTHHEVEEAKICKTQQSSGEFDVEIIRKASKSGEMSEESENSHSCENMNKLANAISKVEHICNEKDIIQDFLETPLLLILIIHVLSSQVTVGKHKEGVNVTTKLTALMRTVVDCLEMRYSMKKWPSSTQNFKPLENLLGKAALSNGIKNTTVHRDEWIEEIDDDILKTALRIGLLQQSKDISPGDREIDDWIVSPTFGIKFYHKLLQEFFAAVYIVENPQDFSKLKEIVRQRKSDQSFAVLKFMSGLDIGIFENVCDIIDQYKLYNNFIDCLHEISAKDNAAKIITKISDDFINITNLQSAYHQEAVKVFLHQCKQLEVTVNFITFHEQCSISFITTLTLPKVDTIEFHHIKFRANDFDRLVSHIIEQKTVILRFVECQVPEHTERKFETQKPATKVYKECKTTAKEFELNFKTGRWVSRGVF